MDKEDTKLLFQWIIKRYKKKSKIITTNIILLNTIME
ncbi:MAG: hypothetical protein WBO70_06275 [Erysipelotrichaceae bacterium]